MIIAVDFDGTCVTHEFPKVGKDIGAQHVLKKLVEQGHQLILYTMRSNQAGVSVVTHKKEQGGLIDAISWFVRNNIPLYGIQKDPTQHTWTDSPKCYAHLVIDDNALGCPLQQEYVPWNDESVTMTAEYMHAFANASKLIGRPFVDWIKVEQMLIFKGILTK